MNNSMTYKLKDGASLSIGYRTPGLSKCLDAAGKMALARELGMSVVEPQIAEREFPDVDAVRAYREAADAAEIAIPSAGCWLPLTHGEARRELDGQISSALQHAAILGVPYVFLCAQHPPEGVPQAPSRRIALPTL